MAGFATHQLVLSKSVTDDEGHFTAFRPEIVFDLHQPPTSITYRPRPAHEVRPLMGGVHIESGPTFLADLSIKLESGQGFALSSTARGAPALYNGLQREQATRAFLALASSRLAKGGYRLEFHSDSRDLHLHVVPQAPEYTAQTGTISRNGGASISLQFIAVGDLDGPIGVMGMVTDWLNGAQKKFAVVSGTATYYLEVAKQASGIPQQAVGLVRAAVLQVGVVTQRMTEAAQGIRSIFDVPTDIIELAADLCLDATDALVVAGDLANAETWHRISNDMFAAISALKALVRQSFGGEGDAASNAGARGPTIDPKFLSGPISIGSVPESGGDGAFAAHSAAIGTYTGWTPYAYVPGDTLIDIALGFYGSPNKWMDIAYYNNLVSPFVTLDGGSTIKLPVTSGGIPFGPSGFETAAAFEKELEEFIYYRDFLVRDRADGSGIDWVIDESDFRDILTVTGLDNFVQRYDKVVFRTDLGDNPIYPEIGVFLGVGQKNLLSVKTLTRQTAQSQLLADPRTVSVEVLKDVEGVDETRVTFDVRTLSAQPASLALAI